MTQSNDVEERRKEAMSWIGDQLETIACSLNVRIANWEWQTNGSLQSMTCHLVATGERQKRTIKMFTGHELDRCLYDKELQLEIRDRLCGLVTFLGVRTAGRQAKRSCDTISDGTANI